MGGCAADPSPPSLGHTDAFTWGLEAGDEARWLLGLCYWLGLGTFSPAPFVGGYFTIIFLGENFISTF